jgi:5-methyltetrahydropteroyltriglutamate--homocysteine methyltransferase
MWSKDKSGKAYPDRKEFVRACVPILRRELELVRDAGADIAQIDDPHLCLFVDPAVRRNMTIRTERRLRGGYGQ